MNAVVLRAEGDRAFSAGLDTKKSYGQPDDIWNHEDPGELLSPKWQKVWKPVVCAVQGICTAGAFYFLNEADIVICSDDATFFDSHVTYGLVCALEPVGLMRKVGLAQSLRIALMGNDERVTAATALADRARHRGRRPGRPVGARPRDRRRHRRQAELGHPGHGPRHLGVARPALPRRHGAGPHLHPPRQPDRPGRGGREPAGQGRAPAADERSVDPHRRGARHRPVGRTPSSSTARWWTYGELADTVEQTAAARARARRRGRHPPAQPAGVDRLPARRAAGRRLHRHHQPRPRPRPHPRRHRRARPAGALRPARRPRRARPGRARAPPPSPADDARRAARRSRRAPTTAAPRDRASPCGCSPAAPPARRSGSTSPTRPSSRCSSATSTTARPTRRSTQLRRGVAVVNSPLVHLGGLFRVLVVRHRRPLVLVPRAVHRRGLGRRRAPPPAGHRQPRAHRAAHGARGRPRSRRPGQPQVGGVGHRPARSRRRRRVHGALRRAGARHLRGDGVRRQRGRLEPEGPPRPLGRQAGERRPRPGRVRAARRRPATGDEVPADAEGVLEVQAGHIADGGWVRTTDLARLDDDGFLYILGRADKAIIRGGFKVLPETIKAALERHPAVRGAAVIGRDDRRLGAVPVAAVELRDDADGHRRRPARPRRHRARPLRAAHRDPDRRRAARAPTPARSTSPAVAALFEEAERGPEVLRGRRGLPQGGPGLARRRRRRRTARRRRRATGTSAGPTTPAGSGCSTTAATPG